MPTATRRATVPLTLARDAHALSSAASSCSEYFGERFRDCTRRREAAKCGVQLARFRARIRLVPDDDLNHAGRPHRFLLRRHGQSRRRTRAAAGDIEADVCVVGGGIAGCSTALHLAERGYGRAARRRSASAGAHRAAAAARPSSALPPSQDKLISEVGRADARRMFDMSLEALDLLATRRAAPHRLRPALGPHACRDQAAPRRRTPGLAGGAGSDYGYTSCAGWSAPRCASSWRPTVTSAACYDTRSGHLHPLKYTLGSRGRGRSRRRADLREAAVVDCRARRDRRSRTASGATVRAQHVVLCCNAYIDELVAAAARAHHAGRHLHRRDRAARRRSACETLIAREHRRRRHQLGARLFPSLGRPPAAVRRARQLFRTRSRSTPRTPRARACSRCSRSSPTRRSTMPGAATSTSR